MASHVCVPTRRKPSMLHWPTRLARPSAITELSPSICRLPFLPVQVLRNLGPRKLQQSSTRMTLLMLLKKRMTRCTVPSLAFR